MKPVKFDNYLVEWANILDGINRLPKADYLAQLHTLDMTGISALAEQLNSIHSVTESVMRNQNLISSTLAMPRSQISAIQNAVNQMGALSGWDGYNRMMKNLGSALSTFSSLSDQLSIRTDQLSGIMAATEVFRDRLSFIDTLGLDQVRLTSAIGLALQRVYENKKYEEIEDISPLVAECYEAETEEEKETIKVIVKSTGTGEKTETQKQFSVYVWKIIIFLFGAVASGFIQSGIDKLMNNNPPVINQYYIKNITNNLVFEGYDVDNLNVWGYRIVNRDIILRAKPGQSSYVTGRLSKGKIVRIIGKYRKWVEVTWNDESGEAHFGWIQNYKLTAFPD